LRFVALDDAFCHACRWRCLTASRFAAFLSRGDLLSRLTLSPYEWFWRRSTTASISSSIFYHDVAISEFDASSDACFALGAEIFTK
jgi:hypothetical protein